MGQSVNYDLMSIKHVEYEDIGTCTTRETDLTRRERKTD